MASHETFLATKRFGSLDGLRCASILAVVWHHSPLPVDLITPLTRGFLGVDLFFVVSGFLITTLLLREEAKTGAVSLKAFYIRRSLRIFPLYYGYILFSVAYFLVLRPRSPLREGFFDCLPYYVAYLSNWIAYSEPYFERAWSLAVEEQFYVVWPPVLVLLGLTRARVLLVVFVIVNQALDFGFVGDDLRELGNRLSPFSAIGLGVLLAMMLNDARGFRAVARLAGHRLFPVLPLAALFALCCVPGDIAGPVRLGIHVSLTCLVAAVVIREDNLFAKAFSLKPVVHIGTISYGIYVLHGTAYGISARLLEMTRVTTLGTLAHTALFSVVMTLVSMVLATLSFRYYEAFFLRLKERFSRR